MYTQDRAIVILEIDTLNAKVLVTYYILLHWILFFVRSGPVVMMHGKNVSQGAESQQ